MVKNLPCNIGDTGQSLKDPTCYRAAKPSATTPEAHASYSLCSVMRSHWNKKPTHRNQKKPTQNEDTEQSKIAKKERQRLITLQRFVMPAGLVPANLNPAHVCYFKNPGVWWMSTDIISTCSPLQLLRYTCVSMGGGGWDGGRHEYYKGNTMYLPGEL